MTLPGCRRNPVIEVTGIDGAGKSSVVEYLSSQFGLSARKVRPFTQHALAHERNISVVLGPEAASAYRGTLLATALLNELADCAEPAVFDRYVESARMWWSVKKLQPLPAAVLVRLPEPDLVILLDIPVEVGLSRRLTTTEPDAESERNFMAACRDYLRNRASTHPNWVTVTATNSLEQVLQRTSALTHSMLRGYT
jgi:thymidylate kinase